MSQPNEECINAGSIDERGFLNTLTKLGLTAVSYTHLTLPTILLV